MLTTAFAVLCAVVCIVFCVWLIGKRHGRPEEFVVPMAFATIITLGVTAWACSEIYQTLEHFDRRFETCTKGGCGP